MLDGISPVLNLAAAANMDLAQASDIVTDYLTAFGLKASDTTHFVDVMAYAMAHSNTDVIQLGEATRRVHLPPHPLATLSRRQPQFWLPWPMPVLRAARLAQPLNAIFTRLATNTKSAVTSWRPTA